MQNKLLRQIFRGIADNDSTKNTDSVQSPTGGLAGEETDDTAANLIQQAWPGLIPESKSLKQASLPLSAEQDDLHLNLGSPASETLAASTTSQVVSSGTAERSPELLTEVSKNLEKLRAATDNQSTILGTNTEALVSNTASKAVSQVLSTATKTASGILGGLTALPLISGIAKLFGGGGEAAAVAPLPKYSSPDSIHFESAIRNDATGQQTEAAGYDRHGNTRLPIAEEAAVASYSSLLSEAGVLGNSPKQSASTDASPLESWNDQSALRLAPGPTPQVTVNIQAMDSRSFLDRSQDIAQAVREAMLNMHSINDVVNDL